MRPRAIYRRPLAVFILILLGSAHGPIKAGGHHRIGPSALTFAGFERLSSDPCLRTMKGDRAASVCLVGRVRHMDGTMTDRLWFLPASESWRDDKRVEHTPSFGALGALERSRALEMENAQRLGGPVDALAAQDLQALRSFGAGAAAALEHPSEPEADPENIAFAVAYASATCLREEDLTSAQALPSSWLGVHHSANGWDIFSDAPRGGLNQNALKRHGQLASGIANAIPRSLRAIGEIQADDFVLIDAVHLPIDGTHWQGKVVPSTGLDAMRESQETGVKSKSVTSTADVLTDAGMYALLKGVPYDLVGKLGDCIHVERRVYRGKTGT